MTQIYLKQRPTIALVTELTLDEVNKLISNARDAVCHREEIELIVTDIFDEDDDRFTEERPQNKIRLFININDIFIRLEAIKEEKPEGTTEEI